jgi:hypothetical protein
MSSYSSKMTQPGNNKSVSYLIQILICKDAIIKYGESEKSRKLK